MNRLLPWLVALAAYPGCSDRFKEPLTLGGVTIQPEVLNRGRAVFRRECTGCHDEDPTEAKPLSSPTDRPPRDLTLGYYKFTSVPDDGLPTDEDLARTIRDGIGQTQMGPRPDLPEDDLGALVQFVKALAPRWRSGQTGTPVAVAPDPWGGKRQGGIARGFAVYHEVARCWTCHPAYVDSTAIDRIRSLPPGAGAAPSDQALQQRAETARAAAVESRYGRLEPPDFLSDKVRVSKGAAGLYRTIAAGVGGTPMPSWAGRLPPADLWAVVYYIQELGRVRGTPEGKRYRLGIPGPGPLPQ